MPIDKLAADFLFVGKGELLTDKVLIHEDGKILDIQEIKSHDPAFVKRVEGILCPGFINTHCHLELSHMRGRIDTGTGLLPFLEKVVGFRDIDQELIDEAIVNADLEMQNEGIVAVGDISNKSDTAEVKSKSPIAYYTFVEMFDFMQESMTSATIDQYSKVYKSQSREGLNKVSLVPHAPYTVSSGLFDYINKTNKTGSTVSIHNQETAHENQFFENGSGGFFKFFKRFGFDMDSFQPTGKTSIHYALSHLNPSHKTIFVHNTISSKADIEAAIKWNKNTFWATCANANLYIENRLPDYQIFIDAGAQMTIGTDSLSSNWQLSVLEEIKTIARYNSYIPLTDLLRWATSNGAEALGYESLLGTFDAGKSPGINLISMTMQHGQVDIRNAGVIKLS